MICLTQIHDRSLSWLGTGTSTKVAGLYQFNGPKPSPLSEMITCILTKRILLVYHYGWQTPSRMNSFVLDRVHIYIDCDRSRLVRFSLKQLCVQIGLISNRLQSFPVITTVHTAHLIQFSVVFEWYPLPKPLIRILFPRNPMYYLWVMKQFLRLFWKVKGAIHVPWIFNYYTKMFYWWMKPEYPEKTTDLP